MFRIQVGEITELDSTRNFQAGAQTGHARGQFRGRLAQVTQQGRQGRLGQGCGQVLFAARALLHEPVIPLQVGVKDQWPGTVHGGKTDR